MSFCPFTHDRENSVSLAYVFHRSSLGLNQDCLYISLLGSCTQETNLAEPPFEQLLPDSLIEHELNVAVRKPSPRQSLSSSHRPMKQDTAASRETNDRLQHLIALQKQGKQFAALIL